MCGVSKADVIKYLEDCRDNSNFGLEKDPREIWPCTNEYSSGFWMVSQKEINLSEGVLSQTPGFTEDFNYLYSNGGMPYYGKTK